MVVGNERSQELPLRVRHPCDRRGRVKSHHHLLLVHFPSVGQHLFRLVRSGGKRELNSQPRGRRQGFFSFRDIYFDSITTT